MSNVAILQVLLDSFVLLAFCFKCILSVFNNKYFTAEAGFYDILLLKLLSPVCVRELLKSFVHTMQPTFSQVHTMQIITAFLLCGVVHVAQ